jgi:hypothetical protein
LNFNIGLAIGILLGCSISSMAQPVPAGPTHGTSPHAPRPATPVHGHGTPRATATAADATPGAPLVVVAGNGTSGFVDGTGAEVRFNKPIRLAPFGPDAVLVADIFNHALRVVSVDGRVRTLAGAPERKGHSDGPAAGAWFNSPHGVGVSADGRIAVAEAGNHTLRLLTPDRRAAGGYTVTTLAGVPGEKGMRNGEASQALFNSPHAALFGANGSLVAPDIGNAVIRRVAAGQVHTMAGEGAERFVYPMDVAWAPDGRLVVADAGADVLRLVDLQGGVTTIATSAPLKTPHGVAVGPDGTIYVADMGTHRVLAIDAAGTVRTIAGVAGEAGSDATHLNKPAAVLVHAGRVWIADLDNHRIVTVEVR